MSAYYAGGSRVSSEADRHEVWRGIKAECDACSPEGRLPTPSAIGVCLELSDLCERIMVGNRLSIERRSCELARQAPVYKFGKAVSHEEAKPRRSAIHEEAAASAQQFPNNASSLGYASIPDERKEVTITR